MLNKVLLIGHVGMMDTGATKSGDAIVNLSLATSKSYKNQQGEKVQQTEWHKITFFRKLAEIVSQYIQKGSKIYVEGELQTQKYTDKDGVEKYTTKIIANNLVMLDSKKDGEASGGQRKMAPSNYNQYPEAAKKAYEKAAEEDFYSDDIPF